MKLDDMKKLLVFARGLGGEVDTMHVNPGDEFESDEDVRAFATEQGLRLVLTDKCPVGRVYFSQSVVAE